LADRKEVRSQATNLIIKKMTRHNKNNYNEKESLNRSILQELKKATKFNSRMELIRCLQFLSFYVQRVMDNG
jgi:hypothetical protein